MPGKASSSPIGRAVGVGAALLAVALFVLDRTTDLAVPYGYDTDSTLLFAVGAVVAVAAIAVTVARYQSS
ncbi:hypothetical protein HZS55_17930 [Halosimplex rubrum]|uniref:Uncharacterized protein n=1 Tax=Halosimplex rubrum TaxID=869889 RepID=A0A7D5PC60_9EURY|nr:hypothetical protein [Halosimplex rubrum]QLH79059.1 hypothetical protein HZS55_17930 [Halosimplex rubrum]